MGGFLLKKKPILITGGAGFFGGLLKRRLLDLGYLCVNIDLVRDLDSHPRLISVQGDIRDRVLLKRIFSQYKFQVVYHCAAVLAHGNYDRSFLWTSNVTGTENIASFSSQYGVAQIVYISSNCLWGRSMGHLISEEEKPEPIELYGKSKWEGESILLERSGSCEIAIFRSPTIIDEGRLGLLSILFEFIDEGRKVWVVGGGNNVYQFIYAQDLVDACILVLKNKQTGIFNVGSDKVCSLREVYEYVIKEAGTGARVKSLPAAAALPAMKTMYRLGLSPLGPYHYRMINEDFVFNTEKIKRELGWHPTLTNKQMLWKAYDYYHRNKKEIYSSKDKSNHMSPTKMGVIRALKWIS